MATFVQAFSTSRQAGLFRQAQYSFMPPMEYMSFVIGLPSAAALEQLQRIGDGAFAELLFVPQIAIELEEPARPFLALRVADQKLDVEVTDDLYAAAVQLAVEVLEPGPALGQSFLGKWAG